MDPANSTTFNCVICEYNLHGLPVDGKCPECGNEIALSIGGDKLVDANPFWLLKMLQAVTLLLICAVVTAIPDLWEIAIAYTTRTISSYSYVVRGGPTPFSIVAEGLMYVGLWLLASPRAYGTGFGVAFPRGKISRTALRTLTILTALDHLFLYYFIPGTSRIWAYLIAYLLIAFMTVIQFTLLRDLARRLSDPFLYRYTPVAMAAQVIIVCILKMLPTAGVFFRGINLLSRWSPAYSLLIMLQALSDGFIIVLLFRYRRLLHQTAETAAARWLNGRITDEARSIAIS